MQKRASGKSPVLALIGGAGLIVAFIASFFVSGEDHYPGRFFIERQAYWNGGTYYVKFTFLTVLFTLGDLVALPLMAIAGLGGLLRNRAADATAPIGWDGSQGGRRLKAAAFVLIATPLWLAYTGAAVFAPQLLEPAGFFASVLLLFVPIVPLGIVAAAFEAAIAPRYLEGQLESVQIVQDKNSATAHLVVNGESFHTDPARVSGLAQGTKVGVIVSGFFETVLRIGHRG